MIAAISSANTMAKPALLPTCRISSTGSSEMMPNATAPVDSAARPRKLKKPDQTTANFGRQRMGIDHGRDGVGGVVEAVHELEAERDQQRHEQHEERHIGGDLPCRPH